MTSIKKEINSYNRFYGNYSNKINPYSKIYNNLNKFLTSLSCICFIIAIILPGGEHMNIPLVFIIITSFLHHFTNQYLYFDDKLYLFFEKMDHIAIINLACSFLNIDMYMFLILCIISLKRKIKDIILIILYGTILYCIYDKDKYLFSYIICLIIFVLFFYLNALQYGWRFENSWIWHLCCLQLFIAMKYFFI